LFFSEIVSKFVIINNYFLLMKKNTLWLFALLICWQINAQVLTESFDGATFPPAGWTNTQESGTGLWNQSITSINPNCTPHSGAAMASFNSYNYGAGVTSALSSANFDLTASGSYWVTFWMYRDSGYATITDRVEVFINTSQNLTNATSLGVINRSSSLAPAVTSNGWYQYSFIIPSTFNTATNYVIFKATSEYGNNIFLDDIVVTTIPDCVTNLVATPNATCGNFANMITWDAVSGVDGYYITVGTTSGGAQVASNIDLGNTLSYSFTGTMATTYYYTVTPYNGAGSATGCAEQSFITNTNGCYCTSAPTSVDGSGITNVQLVSTNFANSLSTSSVYNDHTSTVVDMARGVNYNNVQISFDTGFGYDYNIVIWIDANNDYVLDASEIVYTGLTPNTPIVTHNASFAMPSNMPLGQHRMRIIATNNLQSPSNPCYSGANGETADFTINVIAPTCTPPAATTSVVYNCGASQFSVDVNVMNLGSGTPSIFDGTTEWAVAATGVINVGPFADASTVSLTLLHGTDVTCNLPLGNFTNICPQNDTCATSIPINCSSVVRGSTANGATNTGGNSAADVWYSYSGAAGDITVSLCTYTTYDSYLRVFDACNGAEIASNDDSCGMQSSVTFTANGTSTYYIMVEGYTTNTGAFELTASCVLSNNNFDNYAFKAYPNPVNDILKLSYTTEMSKVQVINMLDQVVIDRNINATEGQINMSELNSGAYIVNVTVGDTVKTIKVIKQ
jgi:hypothetical protein